MSVRGFGAALGVLFSLVAAASGQPTPAPQPPPDVIVNSPDGNIQFKLHRDSPQVRISVHFKGKPVIEASMVNFSLDGVDFTGAARVEGDIQTSQRNVSFPTRGVHSRGVGHSNDAKVPLMHVPTSQPFSIEMRAYDNGVAFRTIVPGADDSKRVPDERTTLVLPSGSTVWSHGMSGHYEGTYEKTTIDNIPAGQWLAPPVTIKLPGGAGYAAITEANLVNYSGMALESDGRRGLITGLGHRQPVSTSFSRRYKKEDVKRLSKPAVITGTITTPWRVVLIGADLNALVNSDIIADASAPPDPALFPNDVATDWVKPGRAVWRYTDGGSNNLETIRLFSKQASELGFEYQIVEGLWHGWSPEQLRDFVEESKKQGVGIFVWEDSQNVRTPQQQDAFFKKLHDFGIAGAKIDFFDHEHKETIDQYQALLRKAAEYHILLDFHGANKPAGETRTWPNEMTREAIRGMENSRFRGRAAHETTLPFTRYLAGHAEYTVVNFGLRRNDTSAAHQIATAAIMYAGVLTYSLNPQNALSSPAVEMIKAIPSVWDETIVLPPSEVGEIAVFARRKGDTWFLAIANGPADKSVKIPLKFLGEGDYQTLMVKDGPDNGTASTTQPTTSLAVGNGTMHRGDTIALDLVAGGGFIAKFSK